MKNSWSTLQESNRVIGRIGVAIETIGMQVRDLVAFIAKLRLIFMALAATAQSDFVSHPIPHCLVPEFFEKYPVVLPHPLRISNAALRSCSRNL